MKSQNERKKAAAIMATDGFEEVELTKPKEALEDLNFTVHLISEKENIKSWNSNQWGREFTVDKQIESFNADDYDILILPGGVINADRLRRNKEVVKAIREFSKKRKTIAAICHGPQLLIEADLVKGKEMTSHRAVQTDMKNAGAKYTDKGVQTAPHFITAQGVDDIPRFVEEIKKVI
jgi:protease I